MHGLINALYLPQRIKLEEFCRHICDYRAASEDLLQIDVELPSEHRAEGQADARAKMLAYILGSIAHAKGDEIAVWDNHKDTILHPVISVNLSGKAKDLVWEQIKLNREQELMHNH